MLDVAANYGAPGVIVLVLALMLRELHNLRVSVDARADALGELLTNARERLVALEVIVEALERVTRMRAGDAESSTNIFRKRG